MSNSHQIFYTITALKALEQEYFFVFWSTIKAGSK